MVVSKTQVSVSCGHERKKVQKFKYNDLKVELTQCVECMMVLSVRTNGVEIEQMISPKTCEVFQNGADIRGRSVDYYLYCVKMMFGEISESTIIRYMNSYWVM